MKLRSVRFSVRGKVKHGILEGNVVRGFRGSPPIKAYHHRKKAKDPVALTIFQ